MRIEKLCSIKPNKTVSKNFSRIMGRIAVGSIVLLCLIPISILVNRVVPDPYMDEIFHVPQAQQYCRGNFRSWDPMITTPPGLYFLSLAYIASLFPGFLSLQTVSSFSELCSTSILRFTNILLAVICSILVYEIIKHLRPSVDEKKATLYAVILSLYPLHCFFAFLYYTDVASLTTVLAMYLFTLKKKYLLSSWFGAVSVLVRQTNIIWMLFTACTGVIEFTQCHRKNSVEVDAFSAAKDKADFSVYSREDSAMNHLRQRRFNIPMDGQKELLSSQTSLHMKHSSGLLEEIRDILVISWNHKAELLISFGPFLVVCLAFVAFVLWNGSIVLGAKDAHAASPHLVQLLYFSVISTLFMFPVHFSLGRVSLLFRQFCFSKGIAVVLCFMALSFCFISVHFFSIAHPYLLADNRHYTFYMWRKVVNFNSSTKYLLVPLYAYSWFSIINSLAKNEKIWIVVYYLACAATLIPAPLIELRYYTIPFFFLILHTPINHNKTWFLIAGLYLSINCFTIYMFLFRPFSWKHEAGIQRFIW